MNDSNKPPVEEPAGASEPAKAVEAEVVPSEHSALADLLGKMGVPESQLKAVRDSMKELNLDESLEKTRVYINDSLTKAREYAKKNPGVVIGGLAALVVAAGLLTATMRRDK
jgi:hypothetical protein